MRKENLKRTFFSSSTTHFQRKHLLFALAETNTHNDFKHIYYAEHKKQIIMVMMVKYESRAYI